MTRRPKPLNMLESLIMIASAGFAIAIAVGIWRLVPSFTASPPVGQFSGAARTKSSSLSLQPGYEPRAEKFDTSGFSTLLSAIPNWSPNSSLEEISNVWRGAADRAIADADATAADMSQPDDLRAMFLMKKVCLLNSKGDTERACRDLQQTRAIVERKEDVAPRALANDVAGERFSEITASSGTGHLPKGHGVACGDWDRDGDVDLFVETGGAIDGDNYHNVLFQNPGQGNHWLTVKLVGKKSNRAAIGARIKVVTAGEKPLTVHCHVSSGSSFGGNPLQQTMGLGSATKVALMEIHWPTSGTTQAIRDIPADQAIEVTEFAEGFRPLGWKPLPQPE
jgi:ASPIC and UnbV